MTFVILILILAGLALLFAGVQNQSLAAYIQTWTGNASTK